MTISNRSELVDKFTASLMADPKLSIGRLAKLNSLFQENLDWFHKEGLSLVDTSTGIIRSKSGEILAMNDLLQKD